VFDISGKNVLKAESNEAAENKTKIDVKGLRKGLYFVSVSYPDKTYTRKFLKL